MHHPPRLLRALTSLVLGGFVFNTLLAEDAKSSPAPTASPAANTVENSVVKIFSTTRQPDPGKPWTKQAPREISGTGIVIEGKRILTTAHVVLYASQIQVQASQSGDKLSASVEYVAPGIDLATLRLEDEAFFDTHPPLKRAPALPQIKDNVLVYGYPTGGTSLSITKGIVSRIEFTGYNYPVAGLRVQIDAAINPGNSGGPALVNDQVIGLAFSHFTNTQNIGYIIPSEEIELFLKDIADGHYEGKPGLFDGFQTLENTTLRAYLKLDKSVQGIVTREPFKRDPGYPLKQWDIITHIAGTPIDNEGMIKAGGGLRVRFAYLVQHALKDGKVPLTVLRGGQSLAVELPVSPDRPKLMPFLYGEYPDYFIFGPLVFSIATEDYVSTLSKASANAIPALSSLGNPLITRRSDEPAFPGEQLVFVPSPFLPHRLSKGYGMPALKVVESVNGIKIRNLAHLVSLLRDAKEKFIVIEYATKSAETMVFPLAETLAATDEILNDNGIRAQGSQGLMAIWNAKPAK
ncbi:MAG: trypsin-like peptidase domain-containing protein [Opitutae bacterium]|nr:trypsin-like peptidase domain-containing protein [Opitutae bacterium]